VKSLILKPGLIPGMVTIIASLAVWQVASLFFFTSIFAGTAVSP